MDLTLQLAPLEAFLEHLTGPLSFAKGASGEARVGEVEAGGLGPRLFPLSRCVMLGSGQDGENEGKGDFGPKMETYLMASEEGEGVACRAEGGVRQGGVF